MFNELLVGGGPGYKSWMMSWRRQNRETARRKTLDLCLAAAFFDSSLQREISLTSRPPQKQVSAPCKCSLTVN